jgi:hypothetical protein
MPGWIFRSAGRWFKQFRYSQQQEVVEDSKEDVRKDVQAGREDDIHDVKEPKG